MNSKEIRKSNDEMQNFLDFVRKAGLEFLDISNGKTGEPDIICKNFKGERVAFEMTRAYYKELRFLEIEIQNKHRDSLKGYNPNFKRFGEFNDREIIEIISKKMKKTYNVNFSINILIYNDGHQAFPDSEYIYVILDFIQENGSGIYDHIWFCGEKLTVSFTNFDAKNP